MFSKEKESIIRATNRLKDVLGINLGTVIAFGSRVRGDFSGESDFDILVVVKERYSAIINIVNDIFGEEEEKTGNPYGNSMTYLMYERLSKEEWETVWPSSGYQAEGRSAVRCAEEFGTDITLLIENLRRSPTERLLRAQKAAASLFALRQEMIKTIERRQNIAAK